MPFKQRWSNLMVAASIPLVFMCILLPATAHAQDTVIVADESAGNMGGDILDGSGPDEDFPLYPSDDTSENTERQNNPFDISGQISFETSRYRSSENVIADLPAGTTRVRRAIVAASANVAPDLDFSASYNFAGSGPQGPRRLRSFSLEYDGLGPLFAIVGIYGPSAGLSADTSATRSLFLYRDSITNIVRGIGSGAGTKAVTIGLNDDNWFIALSHSRGKAFPSKGTSPRRAFLARASRVTYLRPDLRIVTSFSITRGIRPHASRPGGDPGISLSDGPESDAKGVVLISTGRIPAERIDAAMVEGAAQWRNFYVQGGYSDLRLDRLRDGDGRLLAQSPHFSGWYAQGSWVLTGEAKAFSDDHTFSLPNPANPFPSGPGAWELAVRRSVTDLNDRSGGATEYNGGYQRTLSLGLNWYPQRRMRFFFDYQDVAARDRSAADVPIRQNADVLTLGALLFL